MADQDTAATDAGGETLDPGTGHVEHAIDTSTQDAGQTTTAPENQPDPELHRVKVSGREFEVPYDELVNGYQRQADYTRGKQELAVRAQELQQAEAVWQALREDPEGTMQALQEYFDQQGVSLDNGPEPDPTEQRLRQVEAAQYEQHERELQAELDDELGRIQESYGDFDEMELLEFAVDHKIPNLEAAYLLQQQVKESDAEALRNKRGAPPVGGGSRARGAVEPPAEIPKNIEEAFAAAKAELYER